MTPANILAFMRLLHSKGILTDDEYISIGDAILNTINANYPAEMSACFNNIAEENYNITQNRRQTGAEMEWGDVHSSGYS